MSKALSLDLQVRVLAAVGTGMTHRAAGERFGVSAASVSRWRTREREQGDARPKVLGGDLLIPGFDGAVFSHERKDALWVRFTTAAPRRQRQSVERYSIVKRA
jgi:hypothetical protein